MQTYMYPTKLSIRFQIGCARLGSYPKQAFAAGMPETQLPPTVKPGAIGTNRDGRCYEVTPPRVREARVTDGLMG